MIIKDVFFDVNKFNEPLEVSGHDAIFYLIVRLMLMNPGTSEINPDMGVGLVTKWRYCDHSDIQRLKNNIEDQISRFLPKLQGVRVNIEPDKEDGTELLIDIEVNDVLYTFKTDWINNTLKLRY